jgi:hypothetical protein
LYYLLLAKDWRVSLLSLLLRFSNERNADGSPGSSFIPSPKISSLRTRHDISPFSYDLHMQA